MIKDDFINFTVALLWPIYQKTFHITKCNSPVGEVLVGLVLS